jgi:hypothetical protein
VRVGCDAAHETDPPTCCEELGDFGTDVRRIGRLACSLMVDALEPGLVGAGGFALVAVGGAVVMRLVALWAQTAAPKLPLGSAYGDEPEPVRARLRERVSSPCGDDGGVEPAGLPLGGGGCDTVLISSCCMLVCESKIFHWIPHFNNM